MHSLKRKPPPTKDSEVRCNSFSRDTDEKPKIAISNTELAPRENVLHVRLSAKEQEIQDLLLQIQELKASQIVHSGSINSTFLDPAVNALIQSLREELNKAKSAQEETQNELNAWKFTPDSNTGKRLMAKCRLLYQENEELGKMISSGRLAKLEGELALQKNFSEEMKKSQSELDEFLLELDEDVEGMQSTIYFLQQQLRQTREQLYAAQKETEVLKNPEKIIKQEVAEADRTEDIALLFTPEKVNFSRKCDRLLKIAMKSLEDAKRAYYPPKLSLYGAHFKMAFMVKRSQCYHELGVDIHDVDQ
uniref:EOG090X0FYD n=1 Tax=Moina brachiata TaxID=675436 RepID=A0A4Y7NL54_9CRUS|nr:EOG090X0FYD [Moina brachiata]SVE93324.1 EOG090X0FYD [Moina brachiata]